jgi:predicted RNase H-like HicB family nuclease
MVVHEAEEGGYWASFPELAGCFTQGETLQELRDHAREAVSGHLAVLHDQGDPLPEPVLTVEPITAEAGA